MRYPEQFPTENEERDGRVREKGKEGEREKVRRMNLYREEAEARRGKKRTGSRIYTCIRAYLCFEERGRRR